MAITDNTSDTDQSLTAWAETRLKTTTYRLTTASHDFIQATMNSEGLASQINAQCKVIQSLKRKGDAVGSIGVEVAKLLELKEQITAVDPDHRLAITRAPRKEHERAVKKSRKEKARARTDVMQTKAEEEYQAAVAEQEASHERALQRLSSQHQLTLERLRGERRNQCNQSEVEGSSSGSAQALSSSVGSEATMVLEHSDYVSLRGTKREGLTSKIRPRNWGYTTHLDRVFAMRCFKDLAALNVFPDAKDISESMGGECVYKNSGLCSIFKCIPAYIFTFP
jgi:hypothetical protein